MLFFGESKYNELEIKYLALKLEYNALVDKWNNLVKKVNKLGGSDFLSRSNNQFTLPEIRTLIKLCHPDKHKGDPAANEITKKLIEMKDK